MSYYHVAKQNTHHLLGVNPRLTSVLCMLRLAHSPLNINKKSYRTCVCSDIETEIHLFFHCNFHDAARAILYNRVYNIVTNNISPEFFDCLSNVSCCVFSYLACLITSHHISRLLCFVPWMIFSSLVIDFDKSCNRF